MLSLVIPRGRKAVVTLNECLSEYLATEIMDEEDGWYAWIVLPLVADLTVPRRKCKKCRTVRAASKATAITRLPEIAIIHLQRTIYRAQGVADKDTRAVEL